MAFPQPYGPIIETTTSSNTSHAVNMPSEVFEGDLLVMFVSVFSANIDTPTSGWVIRVSDPEFPVYIKRADGAEGSSTATITTDSSGWIAAQVYRITRWADTGNIFNAVEAAVASGSSSTPDPPELNPSNWDIEDTLWIASLHRVGVAEVSSFPTNYTNGLQTPAPGVSTTQKVAIARRENAVASENPGTFSLTSSDNWDTRTIAIRPRKDFTVIASDTFTDSDNTLLQNHESDSGHDWIKRDQMGANDFDIQGNMCHNEAVSGSMDGYVLLPYCQG